MSGSTDGEDRQDKYDYHRPCSGPSRTHILAVHSLSTQPHTQLLRQKFPKPNVHYQPGTRQGQTRARAEDKKNGAHPSLTIRRRKPKPQRDSTSHLLDRICWRGRGEIATLVSCWRGCKECSFHREQCGHSSKRRK